MIDLELYGFDSSFQSLAESYKDLIPGRITGQHKNTYNVITANGQSIAELSGKFLHEIERENYPVVGDFVMVMEDSGTIIIHECLERKTFMQRRRSGEGPEERQGIAANIDIVFICMSLNQDFNISRLERYLSLVWSSNAQPVIVLTKKDLCDDIQEKLTLAEEAAFGVNIILTSQNDSYSTDSLAGYIHAGSTAVFAGSSGVGKTTLINALMKEEAGETKEISDYGKGKHTTTSRELFLLSGGGCLIDTPGMRELGVDFGDVGSTFPDIEEMSQLCRFKDCGHVNEPGCAVLKALNDGELNERRYNNYLRLKKESKYSGLNSKQIETEKLNTMLKDVGGMKNMKKFVKEKNKQKGR